MVQTLNTLWGGAAVWWAFIGRGVERDAPGEEPPLGTLKVRCGEGSFRGEA